MGYNCSTIPPEAVFIIGAAVGIFFSAVALAITDVVKTWRF